MPRKYHSSKVASANRPSERRAAVRRRNLAPLWIGLALLVVIGAAFLLLRPQSTLPAEVRVAQAYDMYQNGALFLDVRTPPEYDQAHIEGSLLIPLDELQTRLNALPRDKDIVVICRSGARSKEGATLLRQNGFARVTCMTGGIQAWLAAGYPVIQ